MDIAHQYYIPMQPFLLTHTVEEVYNKRSKYATTTNDQIKIAAVISCCSSIILLFCYTVTGEIQHKIRMHFT